MYEFHDKIELNGIEISTILKFIKKIKSLSS